MAANSQQEIHAWREASRDEIREYYRTEFPSKQHLFPDHVSLDGPKEYAISFGDNRYPTQGGGRRKFIRRSTRKQDSNNRPVFTSFDDLHQFIQDPGYNDPLQGTDRDTALTDPALVEMPAPCPHAVYYALDHWERTWVLAFDIDAKDITKGEATSELGVDADNLDTEKIADASGILEERPEGYPYAFRHVKMAIEAGFTLESIIKSTFDFRDTMVVYSGQGCHVYGLDDDRTHKYDQKVRQVLNTYIKDVRDIPIDTHVTADRKRVIRLPGSLHSEVSRIVTPIESPDFDPRTSAIPEFLTQAEQ